ncbi:MAG: terpene cyclase/mutase family protein, partial [Solirubrobacterales bacterium]|nr:terpene cyclase/mutase family protein [Solirubrobacterales bacterium]
LAPTRADASPVSRAAAWLVSEQNADGGFGASPGDDSGAEITCWAMLGLEAAGRNPLDVSRAGNTPLDFLRSGLSGLSTPGDFARTVLALEGAGIDPHDFGGQNLVSKLLARRRQDGSFQGYPSSTAFAVIALRTAGAAGSLGSSLEWLQSAQNDDGGWGIEVGAGSEVDGTGAVLQALASGSKASKRGVGYLEKVQRKGGGFGAQPNDPVNAQTTAWAIQGILAAGRDPSAFRRGGASAPEYLAGLQQSDGHYRYSGDSDQTPIWVTGEALVAAAGDSFPVAVPPREPSSTITSQPSSPEPTASGGLPPSSAVPPSTTEPSGISPGNPAGGGGGTPPGHSTTPAEGSPGAKPKNPSSGGGVQEGSTAPAPGSPGGNFKDSTLVSEPEHSSTSPAGAIALGLLAGCLLFGAAWGGRWTWMRWRYGV